MKGNHQYALLNYLKYFSITLLFIQVQVRAENWLLSYRNKKFSETCDGFKDDFCTIKKGKPNDSQKQSKANYTGTVSSEMIPLFMVVQCLTFLIGPLQI